MIKKKRLGIFLAAIVLMASNSDAVAQLVNNGAKIFIDQNALLYVGDKVTHNFGSILNNGEMVVGGDWVSNRTAVFALESNGKVRFTAKRAVFSGNSTTSFPRLAFAGQGVFEIKNNVDVRLSLDLGDAEVQLNDSQLHLDNSGSSLLRNKGFVSTTGSGQFVRHMDAGLDYVFPLGSSRLGIMRFVSVKSKDASIIGASFYDKDPSVDGYSRFSKENAIIDVNDSYYHILKNWKGSGAVDVSFYTSSAEKYTTLVNWTAKNNWDRVFPMSTQDNSSFFPGLSKSLVSQGVKLVSGIDAPFAFAQVTNAGPLEIYNAFSPDGDGKNDKWEVKNIDAFPDNDLKIFDRSGNLIYRVANYSSAKYWDGQNVGSGTYFYVLRVKIDGKDQLFKGSITMVKN
ncbi:gliding motility-associated C-terminal domain-containing protein [Pedobacter nanyangensis]|uniref:gliding motility-associated C-terminal domain-containing protein n=1 Tax=Pedobacter nanyangensis TaxID=1562389 RepID=UPI000DE1E85D|nr:gliding motility-associated C-terminal domain-containing protein [Pedobacter nanyangensis]